MQQDGVALAPGQHPLHSAAAATTNSSSAAPPNPRVSFSETALEWIQRTKRKRALAEIPRDPASAAWSFFRPSSRSGDGAGNGIAFVDAALRRQSSAAASANMDNSLIHTESLPVVELRGICAKTWTLLTLAARFVVATRPSQFDTSSHSDGDAIDPENLPQVIFLDSTFDYTVPQLTHVVRSTLLRRVGDYTVETFEQELNECLGRIHVVSLTESHDAVALLEVFRAALAPSQSDRPTLVLWDGYLDTFADEPSCNDVIRQMSRLLQDCSVAFVSASSSRSHGWDKFVTHRIRLDRNFSENGHEYLATVHGSRIPFSISLAGILS